MNYSAQPAELSYRGGRQRVLRARKLRRNRV